MIEAFILFAKEQYATLSAVLHVLSSATTTTSSINSTIWHKLTLAWSTTIKNQQRSIRSAFIQFVAFYCLFGSLIFGGIMYSIENQAGTPTTFVDCLFTMASGASSTGLIVVDTAILQVASQALICFIMFAWANTLLIAATPILFRICRLRTARKHCKVIGERLLKRREAFHLLESKELIKFTSSEESLSMKKASSSNDNILVDMVVKGPLGTSSNSIDIFSEKSDMSNGNSTLQLPSDKYTSTTSQDSLKISLPFSSDVDDTITKKTSSSRRNSRREISGQTQQINDMSSSTGINVPEFSTPTKSIKLNVSIDPVIKTSTTFVSVKTPTTKSQPLVFHTTFSLEKKALEALEAAHATHDELLTTLENGPYLLGHYLIYVLIWTYYLLILFFGFIAYIWHFSVDPDAMAILARNPATNKVSPSFFSAFFSVGMFTNTGFHLLPDNMIQLGSDRFTIIVSSVLATLGFSLYPLGLRVFVMMICAGSSGRYKVALRDILDNPRRYYTHLFSEKGTWAATLMSLSMTGLLFVFFLIFNFPDTYFKTMFPQPDIRAMNGWFESIMVYNAGYNTYDLSMMDVGSQVWIMLCMWATGRPFTLGILVTASESSISSDDSDGVDDIDSSAGSAWTVLRELLMLLRSDLIILVICTLMICMYDNAILVSGIFTGPNTSIGTGSYIGVFPIAFDLSSAYGNVGLSLGYPNTVTSSCAVLSSFGKLVVIFMW
jgi:Trk-type K+ transport system membrane component